MLSRCAIRGEPGAANTVKHGRVQNAAEGLNRDEIRSRQPRDAADVDPPVQAIPTRGTHQRGADEAMDRSTRPRPVDRAISCRKECARLRMSSRRSRSGGMRISNTLN